MPRFAANLSMLFTEMDFLDRFAAAAEAGFSGVEYLFPYDYPAEEIKARLDAHNLTQVLFNHRFLLLQLQVLSPTFLLQAMEMGMTLKKHADSLLLLC